MEEVYRPVKRTEKQMLSRWDLLVKEILESTETNNDETEEEQKERIAQLEAQPEEWFKYYFPAFTYAPSAAFHRSATERVLQNREWYEVRMWSRELAKSTRTMMEVLYLALVGHPVHTSSGELSAGRFKKRYILMISNSLDNAVRLLMPYRANLEYNRRLIKDYGEQQNHGSWQETEFITQKGVAFRALGAGQSPRGTRK
jgi:DNA polymerase III psi subunit